MNRRSAHGLVEHALDCGELRAERSLLAAVRATRWKLIAAGKLDPVPDEILPAEVWRARRDRTQRLAA